MLKKFKYQKLVWIDVASPSPNEVRELMNDYSVNPLVAEELLTSTRRSRVDFYDNLLYLILHFPALHHSKGDYNTPSQEIDFVIGKDFIVTTHYESVDQLLDFAKIFETSSILDKSEIGSHAGYIFFFMIRHIYRALEIELEIIRDNLSEIEKNIFDDKEKAMVIELSKVNRRLLGFKEALALHKDVLESFESSAKKFFGENFRYHLRSILGEYYKVQTAIESNKEYLDELRETNDSLLSTKQNETMKILTIMAFVTFPLSLIAGIFGMNTHILPIVGLPQDFWIIIGIMVIGMVLMFSWFKSRHWLD